jgi:predicted NBD/HSP70 family sugar kinase
VKLLLWQKGGCTIQVAGPAAVVRMLSEAYAPKGLRAFDRDLVGRRMFGQTIRVEAVKKLPAPRETQQPLGRHLEGCRIGFDLGGSDRKCAAVVDGEVVFSEEVAWNPYFEKDPFYHFEGIHDTLRRAAAHLPRVDAIGGSAAGVYVNSEPRVGSLYRGIAEPDFDRHIRGLFRALQRWWGGVPFEVVNDGEVTALAGSMSMKANAVLGYSMGTSVAAGYVTPDGNITSWLNELAFVPVDYRKDAPADEWSGDVGCGVQYFSQQAVGRLLPAAGIEVPKEMPLAERSSRCRSSWRRAMRGPGAIYETMGTSFGYAIAHYADFYEIGNMLVLGRVTSGEGGEVILAGARQVLKDEFPALAERIRLRTPDEKDKRHGQAIAAASLPVVPSAKAAKKAPRNKR